MHGRQARLGGHVRELQLQALACGVPFLVKLAARETRNPGQDLALDGFVESVTRRDKGGVIPGARRHDREAHTVKVELEDGGPNESLAYIAHSSKSRPGVVRDCHGRYMRNETEWPGDAGRSVRAKRSDEPESGMIYGE